MPDACAAALVDLAARDREAERTAIRQHYADALSWEHIGTAHRPRVSCARRGAARPAGAMKIALVLTGGLHPERARAGHSCLALADRTAGAASRSSTRSPLRHLPEPHDVFARGRDRARPRPARRPMGAVEGAPARHSHATGHSTSCTGTGWTPPGFSPRWQAAVSASRASSPATAASSRRSRDIDYGLQRSSRGRALVRLACRLATRGSRHDGVHGSARPTNTVSKPIRLPMGVDLARVCGIAYATQPPDREDGPPWRLLQVASLNRVKDQSTLLRALAIVRRTLDVRLDLVGEDTFGDGRLQREAAIARLADAVRVSRLRAVRPAAARSGAAAHSTCSPPCTRPPASRFSRPPPPACRSLEPRRRLRERLGTASAAVAVPPADPEALAAAIVETLQNRRRANATRPPPRANVRRRARRRVDSRRADRSV